MRKRFEAEDLSQRPLPPVEVEANGTIELRSVKEVRDKYLPPPPPPLTLQALPYSSGPPPLGLMDSSFGTSLSPPNPPNVFTPPVAYNNNNHRRHSDGFNRSQNYGFPHVYNGGGRQQWRDSGHKRGYDDVSVSPSPQDNRRDSFPVPNSFPDPNSNSSNRNSSGSFEPATPDNYPTAPPTTPAANFAEPARLPLTDLSRKIFSYKDVDAPKVPPSLPTFHWKTFLAYIIIYVILKEIDPQISQSLKEKKGIRFIYIFRK